ncbi:hypothetical protein H0H92_002530, partial [Tricholoma furcatifolium]
MSFPQRRVLYRLQPVAFDTCLELWDFEEEGVRLQSVKEIDLQQWLFIGDSEISGSEAESVGGDRFDRFYIVSAPTKAQRFCRYLTVLPTTGGSPARPQALTEEEAEPSLWTLTKSKTNDGSYFLITQDSDGSDARDIFLQVTMNGEISTVKKPRSNNLPNARAVRWKIIDYHPSISSGTYKIKAAIDSNLLEISANFESLSVAGARNDFRQQNVRNQIWLFEDVSSSSTGPETSENETSTTNSKLNTAGEKDKPTGENEQQANDKDKAAKEKSDVPPPYTNPYLNVRYPEIKDGIYSIRNLGTRDYMVWTKHRQYVRSYWDALEPSQKSGGNFLKYKEMSNVFWLYQRMPHYDEYIHTYARFREGYLHVGGGETDATTFVLEHVGDAFTSDQIRHGREFQWTDVEINRTEGNHTNLSKIIGTFMSEDDGDRGRTRTRAKRKGKGQTQLEDEKRLMKVADLLGEGTHGTALEKAVEAWEAETSPARISEQPPLLAPSPLRSPRSTLPS